jgi:ribosomal protein L11 methyltransferase
MNWTQVSVTVDGEGAEAAAEVLRRFAHQGVSLELPPTGADSDIVVPDAYGRVRVSIYLPEHEDTPARRRQIEEALWHLGQIYPVPDPSYHPVREEDWASAWKEHYTPFRIGRRILVCPAWETPRPGPDDVVVQMDPGMAFGTGLHPTTRMCLESVEEHAGPGVGVLDLGTGSGILAIAAALLGARPVLALDTDQVAVRMARQNCDTNDVADTVQVVRGSLRELQSGVLWDLVLVNILAPVIVQLLRDGLAEHVSPGGVMVLSGIIDHQAPKVLEALDECRVSLAGQLQVRDWVTLCCRRPAA